MRGRRIKDYLEKVQSEKASQKMSNNYHQGVGDITINQPTINMYPNAQISIIDSQLSDDQNTTLRKQTGTQVHSTSSFNQLYTEDYGANSNPSLPTKSKQ